MRIGRRALIRGPILLSLVLPVLAHHSFEAEYDFNKTLKVTGTVTKMEWMNPHAHFYVDVKDASGKVTNWNFELGAIPVLLKQGWRKDSLKARRSDHGRRLSAQGRNQVHGQRAASHLAGWPQSLRRILGGRRG